MTTPTTTFNFDEIVERRGTDSGKWGAYDADVIPMWVADMDFRSPPAVIEALHERIEHGVFGYGFHGPLYKPQELLDTLRQRVADRYGWQVQENEFLFVPNIVSALYGLARTVGEPGDAILVQTPNYWPFFSGAENAQRQAVTVPVVAVRQGAGVRYEIDFDAFEAAITPRTRLFILGNPHNPIGRAYEKWELEKLADICLRHNLVICSDEIHCDLILDDVQHIALASLAPEIAQQTITFMAPSKTFNVPGLKLGFAISQNPELLAGLDKFYASIGVSNGIIGFTAALAAYRDGQPWLDALLDYLRGNRDYAFDFITRNMPGIVPTLPEATYLMLLDCRELAVEGDPSEFFLKEARVALSGAFDSQGFARFARLNFGCPRPLLVEALNRMHAALNK
jgi:cystathionine beta-lyase